MTKEQILEHYDPIPYSGCWIWSGGLNSTGYGCAVYEGKQQLVHRIVYKLTKGEIPAGMYVCHKCDIRSCINPDHLFLGTSKDNTQDAILKNRLARGGKHGGVKLTEKDVKNIRELFAQNVPQTEIANIYGVSKGTIWDIKEGRNWGWLE
jgi:hypothetical protein